MSLRAFVMATEVLRQQELFSRGNEPGAAPPAEKADVPSHNAQQMQMLMGGMAGMKKR